MKKARILSYKWLQQPLFSAKTNKLLNSIFVEVQRRANLEDLMNSDFLKSYSHLPAEYIDFKQDVILPEEKILTLAEEECHVDRKKV